MRIPPAHFLAATDDARTRAAERPSLQRTDLSRLMREYEIGRD